MAYLTDQLIRKLLLRMWLKFLFRVVKNNFDFLNDLVKVLCGTPLSTISWGKISYLKKTSRARFLMYFTSTGRCCTYCPPPCKIVLWYDMNSPSTALKTNTSYYGRQEIQASPLAPPTRCPPPVLLISRYGSSTIPGCSVLMKYKTGAVFSGFHCPYH